MRRRDIVLGICSTAVLPLAARAQVGRVPVVALVFGVTPLAELLGPEPAQPLVRAFLRGLKDHGWVEGRNIVVERRSAEGDPSRALPIFTELAAMGVDVIVHTWTQFLYDAAQKAAKNIPTVVAFNNDPVAAGIVASLARPGGNITGLSYLNGAGIGAKRLQLLREVVPGMARVAFIGAPDSMELAKAAAAAANILPVFAPVERPEQFAGAFAAIVREKADALFINNGPVNYVNGKRIADFALERLLPTICNERKIVDDGGLMAYGVSSNGIYYKLAEVADKILKGAKPAELPLEQPTKFEFVINLNTAKALGLTIPHLLLAQADELIE